MIKGFEEQTHELSADEKYVVEILVKRFETKKGKKNIVTSGQIATGLKAHFGIKFEDSRIRKMIQYIRTNDLVTGLIANSNGYFVAESIDEIQMWVDSLISRENAIREIREIAERNIKQMRGPSNFVQTDIFQ